MWDLVKNGIFDVECFTHTDDRADQLMGNGTILFWGAQYGATSIMKTSGLLEEHPDWMYEAIGPLNYADGKQSVQIESQGRTGSPVIFFPSTTKNLEAALTYYDYLNSPEGQAIYSYGLPGVTFDYNEEGLPRANAEYWPDADDTDEEKTEKAAKRKELGIGLANLSRTQLINQQNTWFKEKSVTESLGAKKEVYEEYQEDYVNNRRPIEIIPGYAASGLVTAFDRYQEVAEILDGTVADDYVNRSFFAQSEEEARQILNDYLTKVTTEKDGLYLQWLDWIAENVVGSRDDLAW
jgi:putative aldouronate transport system substrate-binding protein